MANIGREPLSADEVDFVEDTHEYREGGAVRISVTQAIKAAGLIDYSLVPPDVLERARQRGVNLHQCAEFHDREGSFDPSWLPEEHAGYFEGWLRFRRESGFLIRAIEHRRIGQHAGIRYGMTLDREGWMGAWPTILDLKFTAAKHPSWGVQLALYELGVTGRPRVGRYRRAAVQIKPNGSYKLHDFSDPSDGDIARTVLLFTHSHGDMSRHVEVLEQWKINHGIQRAA